MSYLLKSATLVTFDPPFVDRADLRIQSGRIVERSTVLEGQDGEEQIDLSGKLIMPGMVCALPWSRRWFARWWKNSSRWRASRDNS